MTTLTMAFLYPFFRTCLSYFPIPNSQFLPSACTRLLFGTRKQKSQVAIPFSVLSKAKETHHGSHGSEYKSKSSFRPPRDLVQFRRSRFVAHLNELRRRDILPDGAERDEPTRMSLALAAAGRTHENKVVRYLMSQIDHPDPLYEVPFAHTDRYHLTQDAIQRQVPIIRNAALCNGTLDGYADLLLLSSADPFLTPLQRASVHPGSYTVCEVKLAALYTADHVLQASCYYVMLNSLLTSMNINSCKYAYLWMGSPMSPPVQLRGRTLDYLYKHAILQYTYFLANFDPTSIPFPDASLPNLVPWKSYAEKLLDRTDSLHLIAGIRQSQVAQLTSSLGVTTLTGFAETPGTDVDRLIQNHRIPPAARVLHKQAQLQLRSRQNPGDPPAYEPSPYAPPDGIPLSSPSDIFFDMEGFPLSPNGGLEYLFGAYSASNNTFHAWWAHTREQEEAAFVSFIAWLEQQFGTTTGSATPHVYHYGHYEVSALRRVAARTVSDPGLRAANRLEALLNSGLFFDVFKFVKSALFIGDSSYSIKAVEKIVGVSREGDQLADAESSVAMYYEWRRLYHEALIENRAIAADENTHPILHEILSYNRQDCESLRKVVSWLRKKFPSVIPLETVTVPSDCKGGDGRAQESEFLPGACGRTTELRALDSSAISRSVELSEMFLLSPASLLSTAGSQSLAHILHFYVRESAPDRRLFRERVEIALTPRFEDLFYDEKCIVGIRLEKKLPSNGINGRDHYLYSFNQHQPIVLSEGENMALVVPSKKIKRSNELRGDSQLNISNFVTLKSIDLNSANGNGQLLVSFGTKSDVLPPSYGVLVSAYDLKICDGPLRQSVLRRAEEFYNQKSKFPLAAAFLNRNTIIETSQDRKWVRLFESGDCSGEDILEFLASRKSSGVFVMQGPPGTGKTRLSGQLIRDLILNYGKTVAVTSNSHAAIDNLLQSTVHAGLDCEVVWKIGSRTTEVNGIKFKPNLRDVVVESVRRDIVDGCNKPKGSFSGCETSSIVSVTNLGQRKRQSRSNRAALVGATCYQLCREENDGKFDFLFIDEASQVPMAHMVAMSASAKYAVLVGDQRQLEMPIKGGHFGDVGQSCLSYIVGGDVAIVHGNRGVFLGVSYRMNDSLCRFVSDAFYEGALSSNVTCRDNHVFLKVKRLSLFGERQMLNGVVFCQASEGSEQMENRWQFYAEVQLIRDVIHALIGSSCVVGGVDRQVREEDFVVVAPYNAQVRALRTVLSKNVRVGTVDKFQGQEAAIAIISTCTSSSGNRETDVADLGIGGLENDGIMSPYAQNTCSPSDRRGIRFCLQSNRLNVAISRAQCVAIVVGNSDACARLPLHRLDDIDVAALYEQLVLFGGGSAGQAGGSN